MTNWWPSKEQIKTIQKYDGSKAENIKSSIAFSSDIQKMEGLSTGKSGQIMLTRTVEEYPTQVLTLDLTSLIKEMDKQKEAELDILSLSKETEKEQNISSLLFIPSTIQKLQQETNLQTQSALKQNMQLKLEPKVVSATGLNFDLVSDLSQQSTLNQNVQLRLEPEIILNQELKSDLTQDINQELQLNQE
jgi:hypothetical protein